MPTRHNSETTANELFIALVGENNAHLPDIDLYDSLYSIPWTLAHQVYQPVEAITVDAITERKVGGNGIFDALMAAFEAHLDKEYKANRITGAEYTKAYIALTEAAMANAIQFALGKDQSFWLSARAQADTITARVNNELARLQVMMQRAQYALTKLQLATEDSKYGNSEYEFQYILPAQQKLLTEQMEAQRAQTADTRSSDQNPIQGMLGKQKELYDQQIKSYKADVKVKGAKMFMDSWITQKTLDENLEPPDSIKDTNLNPIFNTIRDTILAD